MDEKKIPGDAQAIIEAMERLHGTQLIDVGPTQAVVVPKDMNLLSVQPLLESVRLTPKRRSGTVRVGDLDSMIAISRRFADPDSLAFAQLCDLNASLTCVFNYDRAGPDVVTVGDTENPVARWNDHLASYTPKYSQQWQRWIVRAAAMTQVEFCEFVEANIIDVLPPPSSEDLSGTRFAGLAEFANIIGGRWAAPTELMTLSRGLSVHVNSTVTDVRNLTSGEKTIAFETQHNDADGKPLRIPGLFLIGIPVFDDTALTCTPDQHARKPSAWKIPIRLRYRIVEKKVKWFLEPWRPELARKAAFEEMIARFCAETGIAVINIGS